MIRTTIWTRMVPERGATTGIGCAARSSLLTTRPQAATTPGDLTRIHREPHSRSATVDHFALCGSLAPAADAYEGDDLHAASVPHARCRGGRPRPVAAETAPRVPAARAIRPD